VLLGTISLASCQPKQADETASATDSYENYKHKKKKYRKKHRIQNQNHDSQTQELKKGNVPPKVLTVLTFIRQNGRAMEGYVGGRKFGNFEGVLPKKDEKNNGISYQEWDVNPKERGKNRGTERLVTSATKAYYTNDHHRSFMEVKE
jgi:guanyl-specific ribonuclease Sa